MKRIFAAALIMTLIISFASVALADNSTMFSTPAPNNNDAEVISPEHGNTDVPEDPSSPQTGYALGIGSVAVLALVCGGAALYARKKAKA